MSAVLATSESEDMSNAWRAIIAAGALLVILRFVLDNFNLGQVNPVVATLTVAHVYLYARDRKKLSAIALVLAASIKLTPALLLVYHVGRLRVKFAAACVALLAAVTLASFLPFGGSGVGAFRAFVNRTVKNEQGFDFAYSGNQSLRGAVARLTDPASSREQSFNPMNAVTIAISVLLLLLGIFGSASAQSEIGAAAPLFCCVVLLSPLSWKAHFVVLILPIGYLIAETWQAHARRSGIVVGAALTLTFGMFNLTSPRIIGPAAAEWFDAHSVVFAAALLIFVASVAVALTRKFGKLRPVC
jgi:hypothetical protein